ncbi:sulfoxide reductase heme-binding subunit YedZ [Solemya velum gill symbiont]|nr:sulfoxide reductase heme-binding subunit YedZ [Solemya velum gill symbiont]
MSDSVSNRWRAAGIKLLLFLLCLLPFLYLLWDAFNGNLGANPVEALTHRSGDWTLRMLLVTLAVTPLRRTTGCSLLRHRRMLGLFSFFYAVVHLTIYVWIDQVFLWDEIVEDIIKRSYITVGFTALMILLPLAVTSTRGMQRRLGKRWKSLHKGAYIAAALGCLHFLWLTRADTLEPYIYIAVFVVLMLLRLKREQIPGFLRR